MLKKVLFITAMSVVNFLRLLSDSLGKAAVRWFSRQEAAPPAAGEEVPATGESREIRALRRDMLSGILEIGERVAREVMVPRTGMMSIEAGLTLDEVVAAAIESEHSRIPVYEETIDNVVGVLYSKDLLKLWPKRDAPFNLKSILRPAFFIPETKPLDVLFREFQRNRVHMAIVIDEYGGTAGLVTMEDVLEEITGEIQDEYDVSEEQVTKLPGGEYMLDARMSIEAVQELLGVEIEKEEFESLGGLAISHLGHLPRPGESFSYQGYRFVIDKATDRKVLKIRVKETGDGDSNLPG